MMPARESRATLQAQQKQLVDGYRRAQLFPKGHPELKVPKGMGRIKTKNGDVWHFNPEKVKASAIVKASNAGRENDILDLGPVTKEEAVRRAAGGEVPVAVVERDQNGTEVRGSAATDKTAHLQKDVMDRAKSPGHTVSLEHPQDVIAGRYASGGSVNDLPDAPWAATGNSDLPDAPWADKSQSSGVLSNSSDDGWASGLAKGAGTAVIKGLGNAAGMFGNLGKFGDYLMARADSAITGHKVEDVLARYAKHRAEMPSLIPSPANVLPTGEDIYTPVLKRTGEYVPESEPGKMAQAGLETAVGMVGPGGGAAALERGITNPSLGVQALKTAAKMAPANAAAGAIGQGVTDATGDPLLGMAAGVAVPGAAGATFDRLKPAAANVARPFAEDLPVIGDRFAGTRDQMVRDRLLKEAQDPDALERSLFPGPMRPNDSLSTDIVDGSKPTTGQFSGDMGILQAERRARTEDNTPFNLRDAEQNAARQGALRGLAPDADTMRPSQLLQQHLDNIDQAANAAVGRIQNGAQELAGRLGPGMAPDAVGAAIRDAVEGTRKEAAAARRALYAAVDPEDKLALVATPVRDAAQEIAKGIDQYTAPLTADETRLIGRAQDLPDVIPFKSLLEMDKDITSSMSQERRTAGQSPAWNRLQQLKGAVQTAIHEAVDNQAAYQARAVARGQMAAEDTIAARLQTDLGNWQHATAEATGTNASGAASAVASGRARPILGANRAEIPSGGRFGDVARNQGLQAGISENYASQINQQPSLLQFLASKGGLGPDAELDAIGATNHVVGVDVLGRRKLIRQGGFPLDYAREAAEEAGYFRAGPNGTSTPREFLDAIDAEIRGQKLYPQGYEGQKTKQEMRAVSEREQHEYDQHIRGIESDLNDAGYGGLAPELKDRAKQLMSRERLDPDSAVERAFAELEQEDAAAVRQSDFPGDRPTVVPSQAMAPNFDEGAAARLAAAKQGHAAYARLYKEGPIGQALKTMGFNDNYVVPNSGLPARVIVRGDKGYETAKTFLKASKNDPEAVSAMQDHALAPLRQSLNPDGTINSAKFKAWKQNYAGALRALDEVTPGFSSRFDNAARASDIMVEAGARAKQQIEDFQKSEAGKFLKLSDPVEVENRVGSMLTDRAKGPTQMKALLGKLQSDPTAIDGLRKAGIDWMTRKFATTAEAGTSGEKVLSSAAFRNFVKDNRPTLSALYPPEQVNMFGRIADDLDRANRSVTATAIKGSPGTAKDALPFLKRSVEEAKKHTSILGAAVAGSLLGVESAGLKGAITGAGIGGGGYLLGSLRAAGIRKAEDMFRDALLNPERARYYLAKIPAGQPAKSGPAKALSNAIRREFMMAPVLTQSQK